MPPLLEYLDSLTTGAGRDLALRTFTLVDQLSGRTMGVRADMTPQVTRIDAHLLNRQGVRAVLLRQRAAHPASTLTATREPLQLGAELYGHAGIEADVEILRLLAEVLRLAEVPASRIDIGHVGIFHALAARAGLVPGREEELFGLLQAKDVPELRRVLADVAEPARSALLALPELYGGPEVLDEAAARLPQDAEITALLDELRQLAAALADLPVSFDLADLRGYHYHSGVVFAAYGADSPAALALGGRMTASARPSVARVRRSASASICANWCGACPPRPRWRGRCSRRWTPMRRWPKRLQYCARGARSSSRRCRVITEHGTKPAATGNW
jgi:ATP phosphoribosyltransferase involved in histidine biosynthesis